MGQEEEEKTSIGETVLYMTTIVGIVWLFIAFVVTITVADDKIGHCRIEQVGSEQRLMGVRNYRPNVTVKTITSIDEGIEIARKLGCRMETDESVRSQRD